MTEKPHTIQGLAEQFIASMRWSPETSDEMRGIAIGNVHGFAGFAAARLGPVQEVPWCACNAAPAEVGACCDHMLDKTANPTHEKVLVATGMDPWDVTVEAGAVARVAAAEIDRLNARVQGLLEANTALVMQRRAVTAKLEEALAHQPHSEKDAA